MLHSTHMNCKKNVLFRNSINMNYYSNISIYFNFDVNFYSTDRLNESDTLGAFLNTYISSYHQIKYKNAQKNINTVQHK